MAICKFFQEGYCRFGNRCWNEHITNKRYTTQYNQQQQNQTSNRHENDVGPNSSSGFSFKAALQRAGQPQPQFQPPPQIHSTPVATGNRFSFSKTFNAIAVQNTPSFGYQSQSFGSPVMNQSEFGFQTQNISSFGQNLSQNVSTFGQIPPQMNLFNNHSSFGVPQPVTELMDSNAGMDVNISEQTSSSFSSLKPQTKPSLQPVLQSPGGDNPEAAIYSPLDSLTPEELNSFKESEFIYMKIPLKAPPAELCF